jgi:hypothetical protein
MATKLYNFVDIENPSATHVARPYSNLNLPPNNTDLVPTDLEVSTEQYAQLAVSDDDRALTFSFAVHALFEFDWLLDVPRADVSRLDITVECLGSAYTADGVSLYVYKHTTPEWVLLDTEPTSGEASLTGAVTADLLDYITAGGVVYVMVEQLGIRGGDPPEGDSSISVDFASLLVTYTSVTAPTVTISAATLITDASARLPGNVTATGGENPSVTMYWGPTDGGQTPGNWANNSAPTSPGQPQGVAAFYRDIAALDPGTLYYFSANGMNSGGTGWPAASLSFTTLPAYVQAQVIS